MPSERSDTEEPKRLSSPLRSARTAHTGSSTLGGFGPVERKLAILQYLNADCLCAARNRLQDAV